MLSFGVGWSCLFSVDLRVVHTVVLRAIGGGLAFALPDM